MDFLGLPFGVRLGAGGTPASVPAADDFEIQSLLWCNHLNTTGVAALVATDPSLVAVPKGMHPR